MQAIEEFCAELCAAYSADRIAPGIQIAWLPDKKLYYISVHRFPGRSIESRTVVSKATDVSVSACLSKLADQWRRLKAEMDRLEQDVCAVGRSKE